MPEIMLNRSGILSIVGQLVARAMPKHVAVEEASGHASARNHALIASHTQRCQALGYEDVKGLLPVRRLAL